jgi:hypothetical protein
MSDSQLQALTDVLRIKCIWCLNLGENYNVSGHAWHQFAEDLAETSVTHLYVSVSTLFDSIFHHVYPLKC